MGSQGCLGPLLGWLIEIVRFSDWYVEIHTLSLTLSRARNVDGGPFNAAAVIAFVIRGAS